MTKSKKITIILCLILFAFVGLFGIFLATSKDSVVKADTTITTYAYTSGTLPFYISTRTQNSVTNSNHYNSRWFNFSWSGATGTSGYLNFFFDGSSDYSVPDVSSGVVFGNIVFDSWQYISIRKNYNLTGGSSTLSYLNFQYYFTTGFNFNIVSFRVYSERWGGTNTSVITTRLIYTDVNNKTLSFILFSYGDAESATYSNIVYTDRIYYLAGSFSDNQYYQVGFDNGYISGYSVGNNDGISSGYNSGYSAGDSAGYARGVNDANNYSFGNVLGAVFDAPIGAIFGYVDKDTTSPTYNQRIGGLLNFNFLGVNLSQFFMSLLTFAIILLVIRLIIGGGK